MLAPKRGAQVLFCWGAVAALILSGCGGEDRPRHQLSGSIMYQGKPVEMGSIRFEADESVGNFAPVCYAQIRDGKYETKLEDSPGAGKYKVMIMGIDVKRIVKSTAPGIPDEMPALFFPYSTTVEVPSPDGKFDFEIPEKRGR